MTVQWCITPVESGPLGWLGLSRPQWVHQVPVSGDSEALLHLTWTHTGRSALMKRSKLTEALQTLVYVERQCD